jgi:uncharacterized integral membrane protein
VKLSVSSARPVVTAFCTVQFETGSTATLEAARDESVTATYSKGCKIGKDGAMLRVSTDTQPPQTLELAVDPPTKAPKPDWKVLWAFVIALVIALVALFVMLYINEHMTFGTRLPHLPATWTFKESWATNVTAGGGILTVVIGSTSVVKAFLGTEADSSIALATVGAAVAGAFLAFGALLVKTIRYTDSESPPAGGFVVGAACTLAGAFGELVTMYATGRKLDLGGLQHGLLPIVILIGAVLVVYATIGVRSTLEIGTKTRLRPSPRARLQRCISPRNAATESEIPMTSSVRSKSISRRRSKSRRRQGANCGTRAAMRAKSRLQSVSAQRCCE